MAVKKTLTGAVPSSKDGKVVRWDVSMKYEQGTEGEADYYTNDKFATIDATKDHPNGSTITNFTPKAEKDWSKADIEAICPIAEWDVIFASQYESVITNPTVNPEANTECVIPS